MIGVAIGSAVATTGSAVVAQSIERTHRAVRQVVVGKSGPTGLVRHLGWTGPSGRATHISRDAPAALPAAVDAGQSVPRPSGGDHSGVQPPEPRGQRPGSDIRWPLLIAAVLGVFALALLVVTGVEIVAGKPLSRLFGVHGSPTTGASVSNLFGSSSATTTSTTTTTTVPSTSTSTSAPSTTTTSAKAPPGERSARPPPPCPPARRLACRRPRRRRARHPRASRPPRLRPADERDRRPSARPAARAPA